MSLGSHRLLLLLRGLEKIPEESELPGGFGWSQRGLHLHGKIVPSQKTPVMMTLRDFWNQLFCSLVWVFLISPCVFVRFLQSLLPKQGPFSLTVLSCSFDPWLFPSAPALPSDCRRGEGDGMGQLGGEEARGEAQDPNPLSRPVLTERGEVHK